MCVAETREEVDDVDDDDTQQTWRGMNGWVSTFWIDRQRRRRQRRRRRRGGFRSFEVVYRET